MRRMVECMCLECGISLYLERNTLVLSNFAEGDKRVVDNAFCSQCGGVLVVVCKAGEQPHYIVKTTEHTG